jgi:hypothetical protein
MTGDDAPPAHLDSPYTAYRRPHNGLSLAPCKINTAAGIMY